MNDIVAMIFKYVASQWQFKFLCFGGFGQFQNFEVLLEVYIVMQFSALPPVRYILTLCLERGNVRME